MRKTLASLLAVAALGTTLAGCNSSTLADGAGDCNDALAPMTQEFDTDAASRNYPGGFVLVIKSRQVVCNHRFGRSDSGNHVPIASASKWLTAIAVLTLVDEGKLSLDAPISAKLPEFTGAKGQITLRQLLSHTSGIPDTQWCLIDRRTSLEECTNEISFTPLTGAPGAEFRYGGSSFQVAGRLAEIAAGESWNELFKHRISDPLGIPFTGWFGSNPVLAGGGWSTGEEYARVLQMVANGGTYNGRRILSDSAIALMAHNSAAGAAVVFTPRNDVHGYGLGVWRDAVDAGGAATQISSPGASGFYPWVDMKRNIVGIVWLPILSASDGFWFTATQKVQAKVRQAYDAGQL
ncbi:MAG TPA: serine hydrolase domain-containing protein [Longimicrobium sp.]|nr:serine hydrolase domain-containing protein [Longimicrobium sp.]